MGEGMGGEGGGKIVFGMQSNCLNKKIEPLLWNHTSLKYHPQAFLED